jgi:hypothetical protein
MRIKALLSAAFAAVTVGMAAEPAAAFDWNTSRAPAGWSNEQVVRHWVYYPRRHHVYHLHAGTDPYAYRSRKVGYYPYHGAGYWRPPQRAHHGTPPTYYPAWGQARHHHHDPHKPSGVAVRVAPWQY